MFSSYLDELDAKLKKLGPLKSQQEYFEFQKSPGEDYKQYVIEHTDTSVFYQSSQEELHFERLFEEYNENEENQVYLNNI